MGEWQGNKKMLASVGLIFLLMLAVIVYLLVIRQQPSELSQELTESSLQEVTEVVASEVENEEHTEAIYVDIKGAIVKPGMYQVNQLARLLDVVELAGGFTEAADTNQVNFSQLVQDQMVIFIPKIGEEIPAVIGGSQEANVVAENQQGQSEKVNINLADSQKLQELNGIGAKKAEAIIDYREEHGSFKSIDDLSKVDGFGEKTVAKLKEQLTI